MSKLTDPPSGPSPVLSARTGIRLTLPELCVVIAVTSGGVLGWSRLDARLSRIEERMDRMDGRSADVSASRPVIVDHVRGD